MYLSIGTNGRISAKTYVRLKMKNGEFSKFFFRDHNYVERINILIARGKVKHAGTDVLKFSYKTPLFRKNMCEDSSLKSKKKRVFIFFWKNYSLKIYVTKKLRKSLVRTIRENLTYPYRQKPHYCGYGTKVYYLI
jgi:hypothetical protein